MNYKAINNNPQQKRITIIGLGPMGQAMTRSYLSAGYSVTVWNRTKSKAEALANEGAIHAETITEALETSELIILSLTDYSIMYKILNGAEHALKGCTLLNLSSDTPQKAREAEKWAHQYGARFLSGGVMVDPPLVGKPEAFIFYSGDQKVFDAYKADLAILGKPDYRGHDVGLAQLYYQALLNIMYTSAAAVIQSIAMIQSAGISAKTFEPYLNNFLTVLPYFFDGIPEEIDRGEYNGDQNNMQMMAAGAAHVAHTSRDAHTDSRLPDLVHRIYNETIASGYEKQGLTSLIEILKKPSSAA